MSAKSNATLSPELAALLQSSPALKDLDLARLEAAVQKLDEDPQWRAEFLKGRFVDNMAAAMDEETISQSDLAAKWGKTRQYVSKLFNENKRVNFTIETMCELAHHLNRIIDIPVLRKNEMSHVCRVIRTERDVINPEISFLEGDGKTINPPCLLSVEFRHAITEAVTTNESDEAQLAS